MEDKTNHQPTKQPFPLHNNNRLIMEVILICSDESWQSYQEDNL